MVNSSERSSVDMGLGRVFGCKTCNSIHAIPEKKQNLSWIILFELPGRGIRR